MYIVKKTEQPINCMDDKAWDKAEVAEVALINWEGVNQSNPKMTARILYSDFGLHVRLNTDDDPILATRRRQNEAVCEDTCMEFFFRPNMDIPNYFNFEFNALGTMYLSNRTSRYDPVYPKEDKNYFGVKSRVTADDWTLMFTVPFEFIDREMGGHTKRFAGNLYKCGGQAEHYLTYYPIVSDQPDFHRPEHYGEFELE